MSLRDALTAIQAEHEGMVWVGVVIECQCPDRPIFPDKAAHAAHVADLQIAYLRDNLAQHGDELGLTQEFAVCVEDDSEDVGVFLYGHRYLNRAIAQRESDEMTERFETFVGTAGTTDWSRADD